MRCRSCNRQLEKETLGMKKPDGSYEDMCSVCRSKAQSQYSVLLDHDYAHSEACGYTTNGGGGYYYEWYD